MYLPLLLGHTARRYWLTWTPRILREQNLVATRRGVRRCFPVWPEICRVGASNPYGKKLYRDTINVQGDVTDKIKIHIKIQRLAAKMVGPGIESRWGAEIFRTRPDSPPGPHNLLYNGYRVSFPGVKWPELGFDEPPTQLATRLKKE